MFFLKISSALSSDHKPSRIDEQKRIINAGGQILQTSGVFRVARGDFQVVVVFHQITDIIMYAQG
jgi:hypothetical protein